MSTHSYNDCWRRLIKNKNKFELDEGWNFLEISRHAVPYVIPNSFILHPPNKVIISVIFQLITAVWEIVGNVKSENFHEATAGGQPAPIQLGEGSDRLHGGRFVWKHLQTAGVVDTRTARQAVAEDWNAIAAEETGQRASQKMKENQRYVTLIEIDYLGSLVRILFTAFFMLESEFIDNSVLLWNEMKDKMQCLFFRRLYFNCFVYSCLSMKVIFRQDLLSTILLYIFMLIMVYVQDLKNPQPVNQCRSLFYTREPVC